MTIAAEPIAAEPAAAEPGAGGADAAVVSGRGAVARLARQTIADLGPFPGRAGQMWRIALLCAIVAAVAALYKTPEPAISCYLIIFLMKRDAAETIGTALGLIVLASVAVFLVILLAAVTIESAFLRVLTIALVSFFFLFLQGASKLGETGGVIALVIAFCLSLVGDAPAGEVVTRGMLYAWQMAAMPMALMVVFLLVLGTSPVALLRGGLRRRLSACAAALAGDGDPAPRALDELVAEGNAAPLKTLGLVRLFHVLPFAGTRQIARDIAASYSLLFATRALAGSADAATRAALAGHIRQCIAALDGDAAMPALPPAALAGAPADGGPVAEAWRALAVLAGAEPPPAAPGPKDSFFLPDAFTNPDYQHFALKATAAAVICYVIYTGLDWSGIHTAMITCYIVSLGTTGETVHKLCLRIGGCLVGATMGTLAVVFVMPHLDTVGGLMVLVFLGCLPGAWIASGSDRIAYAGVQVALAFLLCVLEGAGPTTSLDAGRDRIIGILLGNAVVFLIFTNIWTVSVEQAIRSRLSGALGLLAALARMAPAERRAAVPTLAAAEERLQGMEEALFLAPFEPARVRPDEAVLARLEAARREASRLGQALYFAGDDLGDTAGQLDRLSQAVSGGTAAEPQAREPASAQAPDAGGEVGLHLGRLRATLAEGPV